MGESEKGLCYGKSRFEEEAMTNKVKAKQEAVAKPCF